MGRALRPRRPGDLGAGRSGGPHPGHRPPPSSSPQCAVLGCRASPHLPFPFFPARSASPREPSPPPALACPSPFWAPWSHRCGPGVFGPSRLHAEAEGYGGAFTHPRGQAARNGGAEEYLRDRGFRRIVRGHPQAEDERPGGVLGGVSHLPIIKS